MKLAIIFGLVLVALCLYVDAASVDLKNEEILQTADFESQIRNKRDATCLGTDGRTIITSAQCLEICKQNGYEIGGCLDGFCQCAYRRGG